MSLLSTTSRLGLPFLALVGAASLVAPGTAGGYTLTGWSLDLTQRTFRIHNNFTDVEATVTDGLATVNCRENVLSAGADMEWLLAAISPRLARDRQVIAFEQFPRLRGHHIAPKVRTRRSRRAQIELG